MANSNVFESNTKFYFLSHVRPERIALIRVINLSFVCNTLLFCIVNCMSLLLLTLKSTVQFDSSVIRLSMSANQLDKPRVEG